MPYPFTLGSALLRTQRATLPRTFCRYKSITAAIERGRGSGPDRFSGPSSRPRSSFRDGGAAAPRYDDREGGSSRPSRSKSSIGARRRRWEDEGEAPRRKELRRSGGRVDESAVDRRIRDQDREAPARFGQGERFSRGSQGERVSRAGLDGGFSRAGQEQRSRRFAGQPETWERPERRTDNNDRAPRGDENGRPRRTDENERPRRGDENERPRRSDDDRPRRSDDDRPPRRTFDRDERAPRRRDDFPRGDRPNDSPRDSPCSPRHDRDARTAQPARSSRFDRMDRTPRSEHADRPQPSIPSRADPRDRAPDSLPYSTAASEFVYGYSSVLAAIRAHRRQFYKLYVNARGLNRDILLARAKAADLRQITREVGDQYDRAFDKASSGRPHNGFILEASPLPVPPIVSLAECTRDSRTFTVELAPQTKEELAVNGTRTAYPYTSPARFPLILYLDGILDEGNLGAIARSAYFLGVQAIVTPTRQSAPWSHIAVKASAGAAEAIPLFRAADPADFLGRASRNGWRCYAAAALPESKPHSRSPSHSPDADDNANTHPDIIYTPSRSATPLPAHSPLLEHPTILMLGAEGAGLKAGLLNAAHYRVGIARGRAADDVGVESLNVSVAAGLLCQDILSKRGGEGERERDPENVVF